MTGIRLACRKGQATLSIPAALLRTMGGPTAVTLAIGRGENDAGKLLVKPATSTNPEAYRVSRKDKRTAKHGCGIVTIQASRINMPPNLETLELRHDCLPNRNLKLFLPRLAPREVKAGHIIPAITIASAGVTQLNA